MIQIIPALISELAAEGEECGNKIKGGPIMQECKDDLYCNHRRDPAQLAWSGTCLKRRGIDGDICGSRTDYKHVQSGKAHIFNCAKGLVCRLKGDKMYCEKDLAKEGDDCGKEERGKKMCEKGLHCSIRKQGEWTDGTCLKIKGNKGDICGSEKDHRFVQNGGKMAF